MRLILFIVPIVSFFVTLFAIPYWIARARKAGLIGKDMNKYSKPEVPEVGGIIVIFGFLAGILLYIAIKTFYIQSIEFVIEILAVMATILIAAIIGFIDDILGWKIGLRQYQKPILCLIAAIPLAVINAGESYITLPLIGGVDIGILFPLLIVPIAISGAANGFNMLAGYNGLEAGMGAIILTSIGVLTLKTEQFVALIAFSAVAALIAFLYYNKYPAKIFPGDTLTYSIGALIAAVAILGNVERAALILFIPYFAELVLKARGKLRKESFAIPEKDNSLDVKGVYGLEHIAIKLLKKFKPNHKATEKDVVYLILSSELILALLVIWIYGFLII